MSSKKKHTVVIILSDILQRLGLIRAIDDVTESVEISSFDAFDTFVTSSTDEIYDIAFIEADLLALYGEYFISRRTLVIPVISNSEPEMVVNEEKEPPYIYTHWKSCKLQDKLKEILDENRKGLKKNNDKGLSLREEEVLKEVARGMTNKEIADRLNISMNTVMSHRKNITSKLNIKTVSGLTFYALINGLITGDEVVDGAGE
ncbi:LuxR C-terminal-related transcriptional regulator [Porphyromonadaceae bacterium W3.11]|nr:LuxR C-terminal-related transcriptional regulator [Porphyromonadaceae bacterium W3.11]